MSSAQRSFDDLGTPLHDVTFCVFDVETTGGNPETCHMTEIGAVKVRGGEVLGTFQTLINPGRAIPPNITMLTGITDSLVMRAPSIDQVLPTFLEFMGGSVVVGHNVRFDWSFLQAAVRRCGGPLLGNQRVDTLGLARRLLNDEVPRFGLGELARHYRFGTTPTHRALDDAMATVELLHLLIERASAWGVTGLDDLAALPTVAGHPQWRKLALTNHLPRRPGVYQFVDRDGRVLYVGKATDLRSRVRSYFSSDRRRKVAQLLKETHEVKHQVCPSTLEAELIELRLIQQLQPRFNRRSKRRIKPSYVKLTEERFPRLAVSGKVADGALGPFGSRREANLIVEALHTALPLRRCSTRIGRRGFEPATAPCSAAQLGVAMCPCTGTLTEAEYQPVVDRVRRALGGDAALVLEPLESKMRDLALAERFEEAAAMRDRAAAYVRAVERRRRLTLLNGIERIVIEADRGARIELGPQGALRPPTVPGATPAPCPDPSLEEQLCVASWLQRHAAAVKLVSVSGPLSSPLPRLPSYAPVVAT